MEFRVLGPTELWSAGQPCELGPARERSVLAILLLSPRTIVPVGALIDRLWDTDPPAKARESLSVYVARLRSSLREADALWRGQALAGIRGDWVARMRDSLEEERRAVILQRIECELELGRHADLVGELRGLLAQYPLDETFVAHQMTALYWSGRPGDALSLYRDTRELLAEEQGAEPGPVLAELHQRILRRDPELSVRLASRPPGRVPPPDTLPPG